MIPEQRPPAVEDVKRHQHAYAARKTHSRRRTLQAPHLGVVALPDVEDGLKVRQEAVLQLLRGEAQQACGRRGRVYNAPSRSSNLMQSAPEPRHDLTAITPAPPPSPSRLRKELAALQRRLHGDARPGLARPRRVSQQRSRKLTLHLPSPIAADSSC